MDEDRSAEHSHSIEGDLLVQSKCVQVDRVQPALGGGTGREKERIDVCDFATGVDDDGADDGAGYNIDIMKEDEVQLQLVHQGNALLDLVGLVQERRAAADES